MTKLSDVAPEYEALAAGQDLKIVAVEFDKFNYDNKELDRVIVTTKDGKKYSSTSGVIISHLQRKEIQEFLANSKDDTLDFKVVEVQSSNNKNRKYLSLE